MNLKNKLETIPEIYYINLDNRKDRKEYMESQFEHWGIKKYKRISGTKYLSSKMNEWQYLLSNEKKYVPVPHMVANFITHLEMIKDWLETTSDPYFIMMEDDYDLSLIEYWNFDWKYLIEHIPFDWDCVQLGYESFNNIHFFLHPKVPGTFFGACLINRFYAQKLIRLYVNKGKFVIDNEINNVHHLKTKKAIGSVDYSICENGKVYCIPLIPQNPHFESFESFHKRSYENWEHTYKTYELYHDWWKNHHHKFSLDDFFTYGKPNDYKMTKKVKMENKQKFNYT